MAAPTTGDSLDPSAVRVAEWIRNVHVDVESTSRPEPGPDQHTYMCDADIRVSEGANQRLFRGRLTVHHPRGWMGVAAGFDYEMDSREYPSFEVRSEHARDLALGEFPSEELISVFLLGTGESEYS